MNERDLICRRCHTAANSDKTTITERTIRPRQRVIGVGDRATYIPGTARVSWICQVCGAENEQIVHGL